MNTEFNVKLTPEDDKAIYSQSLPMPIHLNKDLIVELALVHKYRVITVLPFSKDASPIFAHRKTTEIYVFSCVSGKSTFWLWMTILILITQLALWQTQHNFWLENLFSANSTALSRTTVCRWRINGQWICLHSIAPAEPLPTKDVHKVLADLCLLFKFHARVLGPSGQSWRMWSIRGRHWNRSQ